MKHQYKKRLYLSKFSIRNSFKNFKLPLEILIAFLLIWFFKPKFPNFLGIESTSNSVTLLAVIIGALASILGIIIAVMLVAFEILRRTYTSYAFKKFFQNENLRELFTLYISTIIISILTMASISNPLRIRDFSLIHLAILLFLTSIFVLYPYSKQIIASTQSKEKISEIVNQIDYPLVNSWRNFRLRVHSSTNISATEDNPIFILSEVSIRTIKDNDRLTPKFILIESTNKLLQMLGSCGDKRDTINTFLYIFKSTVRQAIQSQQGEILQTILHNIESIHNFCAENKIEWSEVIELNGFIEEFLKETLSSGLDSITQRGLYIIERIMGRHLKENIPKEGEIALLHFHQNKDKEIKYDVDKDLQWTHVCQDYLRIVSYIIEEAIN